MSAGNFVRARYAASYDATLQIHPIRVQPETLALTIATATNTAPTGALTSPISAQVSRGRRGLGLHARTVTVAFTDSAPAGYSLNRPIRLPMLTPAIAAVAVAGATGVYLENPVQVVGVSPEVVR